MAAIKVSCPSCLAFFQPRADNPEHAATAEGKARFLREARAAAAVQHDHIVSIFDAGEADGQLYLIMPYLEGESLEDRLTRTPRFPIPELLRIGAEIASGLAAA